MKQLNSLTGLRGVAAYSVAIAHGINTAFLYNGANAFHPLIGQLALQSAAGRLAYFGMSLFFILSGFVIHYNYAKLIKSEGLLSGGYQFMSARIARLYPLYILILLLSLDGIPSVSFHNKPWGELAYLTMTQSWFNLQNIFFKPVWSISTEFFFYVAFLFLLPLFERINRPRLALVIFLPIVFVALPHLINLKELFFKDTAGWFIYFSPYVRIFEFIAGMLASKAYLSLQDEESNIGILGYIGMLLCVAWCVTIISIDSFSSGHYSILLSNFMFAPAIAPLLVLCCRFNTMVSRFLSSRPLVFMGEISYSVYLLQFLILTGTAAVYIHPQADSMLCINSIIKIIVVLTLTTLIASGSYTLIEKPSRKWARKMLALGVRDSVTEVIPEKIAYEVNRA